MTTILDIAKKAKVSVGTVSNVINNKATVRLKIKKKEKIEKKNIELGAELIIRDSCVSIR